MFILSHIQTLIYACICAIAFFYLHKSLLFLYHHLKLRWYFPGPKLVSILGHDILEFGEKDLQKLQGYVREYPRMYRIVYGHMARVMVVCPDLIAEVYRHVPDKDTLVYDLMKDLLGDGLITSSGVTWKRNRRLITPLFHAKVLESFCQVFNQTGNNLVRVCAGYVGKNSFDFAPLVRRATFEATINAICSKTANIQEDLDNCKKEKNYMQMQEKFSEGLEIRLSNFIYFFDIIYFRTQAGKRYLEACRGLKALVQEYIQERREQKEDTEKRGYHDMLDLIMKSRDEEGNGMSDREMIDQLNTFFFAGFETSTSGIVFLMYCLCVYPEWQVKCREEINRVIGERHFIEYDDLPKLVCVTSCLKESLRLYSPLNFLPRILKKPLKLDDWTLPKGTMIDVGIQSLHHNPTVWRDPMQYNPDRFNKENLDGKHAYSFIPFSAGPRNCIGQHFSLTEMKILICKLLREFEFALTPGYKLVRESRTVLGLKDGLLLSVKPVRT